MKVAIENRDVIGQAKGLLMARRNVTAHVAFELLRDASQRINIQLVDVARQVLHPNGPEIIFDDQREQIGRRLVGVRAVRVIKHVVLDVPGTLHSTGRFSDGIHRPSWQRRAGGDAPVLIAPAALGVSGPSRILGPVSPARFVPVIEDIGAAGELFDHVLAELDGVVV